MKNIERKKMDGYERYLRVLRIIEDLEKSTVKTTDWYDEHYNILEYYQENLGEYSELYPEVKDTEIRTKCNELQRLNDKLLMEYNIHRWFSLYDYLSFNKLIVWFIDYGEEYELSDLFNNLGRETN
jgi:hypothetical protein